MTKEGALQNPQEFERENQEKMDKMTSKIEAEMKKRARIEDRAEFVTSSKEYKNKNKKNKYIPSTDYKEYERGKEQKIRTATKNTIDKIMDKNAKLLEKIQESKDRSPEEKETIEKIVNLFRDGKIDEVIVAGEKVINPETKEKIQGLRPDLDAYTAVYILNNYNTKTTEQTYGENAKTTVIKKSGESENIHGEENKLGKLVNPETSENFSKKLNGESKESQKGFRVFVDTGGEWMKVEKEGEITTVYLDHHGSGLKPTTSGTKMMIEIMSKAGILKEMPEWLNKFTNFVNDVDNLSYAEKKDKKGNNLFTESYFRNEWPDSMYALAEKQVPFETFIKMCEEGIIKDPNKTFTQEELSGELGNYKIGDKTIKELCNQQREEVDQTLTAIKKSIDWNKKNKLNLETDELGKIIYQDYFKIKGNTNVILDHLAMKATIAKGYNSYVSWNKKFNKFFINSLESKNLVDIAKRLNELQKGCATEVRGKFIFGTINNITEEQFLNTISPDILKEALPRKGLKNMETKEKINNENKEEENRQEQKEVLETISDAEFKNFVDNNIVSDQILKSIAEKQKLHTPLSKREQDIFANNIDKIEKIYSSEVKEVGAQKTEEKTENIKIEEAKKVEIVSEIKKTLSAEEKKKEDAEINVKLKTVGLSENDLKDNLKWDNFTKAEKLLIIEQLSQQTLSQVKELGEKRFQEKNTIKWSKNPTEWKPFSVAKKLWNKLGKSYWISKEEKEVISEVESGKMKPDISVLNSLIERQSEMGLNVVEKNGKAFIEFASGEENLSKEQKAILDKYNEIANTFSSLPDSWKNERAAKSTDKIFGNHFKKYEEVKAEYEKEREALIESKVKQYESTGLNKTEAKQKAMNDLRDADMKISMLQFTNTNPDAGEELKKIRNESSWGRLVNNENIWRSIYMGMGYGARNVAYGTLGLWAAPITAGAIGGFRARRKANENINLSFKEGTKEETFLERREAKKKGLFDDKNKDQKVLSYVLSGEKVNTKEVAAFVDADSQKQRINNLMHKIAGEKNEAKKASLISQLETRLHYIEQKQEQGLINYGKQNSIAKNYELFKTMSEAYMATTTINNLNINLTKEMGEDIVERNKLLASIMARNEKAFGRKMAAYKNEEMIRGAMVAGGFSFLGMMIRDFVDPEHVKNVAGAAAIAKTEHVETIIKHAPVEAVADHGQGAISTLRELQRNLKAEYGDISKAPESVKHILNTDAHKLAQEYGMYKPGSDAESAFLKSGDKFIVDENGNLKFGDNLLEKGSELKASHTYEGRMFDSDHSGLKEIQNGGQQVNPETGINPNIEGEQIDPTTGKPISEETEQVNPEKTQYVSKTIDPMDARVSEGTIEHSTPKSRGFGYASIKEELNERAKPHFMEWDKNFSNNDHVVAITENGSSLKMKFLYDINGKIKGVDIGGRSNIVGPNPYTIESKLNTLDSHTRLDADVDIFKMTSEARFLDKIPKDTPEYKYLLNEVAEKQKEIIKNYGDVINHDKLVTGVSKNINQDEIIQNVNPEKGQEIIVKSISEKNINKIFTSEKALGEWSYIKNNVSAERLMSMAKNGEIDENYTPLINYMNKLEKITGLKPEGKSLVKASESISNYMERALAKAVEMGKENEVKL